MGTNPVSPKPTPAQEVSHRVREAVIELRAAAQLARTFDAHLFQHLVATAASLETMTAAALYEPQPQPGP